MNQSTSSNAPRIAVISACWHRDIVQQASLGLADELKVLGWQPEQALEAFEVPGAYEIPLLAQKLAKTGKYNGIIACGLVVDGGIYRHDFVARAIIDGLMSVQLKTEVPVFSVVLTPHHFHDHDEHNSYFYKHFYTKGQEVARACVQTLNVHQTIA